MKVTIVNLAIEKLETKCKEYFRVDFGKMISFECYYYNTEGKEINLFRKEKEKMKYFTIAELTRTNHAIDNRPTPAQEENLKLKLVEEKSLTQPAKNLDSR